MFRILRFSDESAHFEIENESLSITHFDFVDHCFISMCNKPGNPAIIFRYSGALRH